MIDGATQAAQRTPSVLATAPQQLAAVFKGEAAPSQPATQQLDERVSRMAWWDGKWTVFLDNGRQIPIKIKNWQFMYGGAEWKMVPNGASITMCWPNKTPEVRQTLTRAEPHEHEVHWRTNHRNPLYRTIVWRRNAPTTRAASCEFDRRCDADGFSGGKGCRDADPAMSHLKRPRPSSRGSAAPPELAAAAAERKEPPEEEDLEAEAEVEVVGASAAAQPQGDHRPAKVHRKQVEPAVQEQAEQMEQEVAQVVQKPTLKDVVEEYLNSNSVAT